jgi:hypothetical protein
MKKLIFILILVAIACGKVETIETRVFRLADNGTTPAGVRLRIEPGVSVSDDAKAAIDAGIRRTLLKTQCRYGRSLRHSDYIVAVVKSVRDQHGDPAYKLPCGQYCGSVYDQGGYILVAGQMLAAGEPFGNIIVLPEHTDRIDHMALAAEYEAEHVELSWWDGDEYERTKTHGQGSGHPIITCP